MVLPLGDTTRTRIVPVVTYSLIAVNIIVFFLQVEKGDRFTTSFAATPYEITHGVDIPAPFVLVEREQPLLRPAEAREVVIEQGAVPFPIWLTLFTSMFMHGGVMHLVGNMLYLWIFGDNVEEVLGGARFLIIYICCGLAGSLAQILANPESLIPTLGASGAIAGVMGAYLVWFPHHRVRVLVLYSLIEVPAVLMIGLWIGAQIWHSFTTVERIGQGGVAYLAHVGGAACGIAVGLLYRDRARAQGHPTWFAG